MSIDDEVALHNPLIRGLAFLDSRLGRQRLRSYRDSEKHPLPKALLEIRIVEGERLQSTKFVMR